MTDDPGKQREDAQNASQPPAEEPEPHRFNPFINEEDMFKVVLAVGAACLVTVVVVLALRAILAAPEQQCARQYER